MIDKNCISGGEVHYLLRRQYKQWKVKTYLHLVKYGRNSEGRQAPLFFHRLSFLFAFPLSIAFYSVFVTGFSHGFVYENKETLASPEEVVSLRLSTISLHRCVGCKCIRVSMHLHSHIHIFFCVECVYMIPSINKHSFVYALFIRNVPIAGMWIFRNRSTGPKTKSHDGNQKKGMRSRKSELTPLMCDE